jgi:hypothetical protein
MRYNAIYSKTNLPRIDLCLRDVFYLKRSELENDLYLKDIFEKVRAHCCVTEFQKRSLPHEHILIILEDKNKFHTPEKIDQCISAEIPNPEQEPELYKKVIKYGTSAM